MRPSRQGKYLSVTCVVRATSREQLDALYQELCDHPVGGDGAMTLVEDIVVRQLGRVDYLPTWQAMREFTRGRQESTPDELWLVEHPPVYTVGQGASVPSLANAIPVVKTDRGGDITYHGPGQVVLYTWSTSRAARSRSSASSGCWSRR